MSDMGPELSGSSYHFPTLGAGTCAQTKGTRFAKALLHSWFLFIIGPTAKKGKSLREQGKLTFALAFLISLEELKFVQAKM